MVGVLVWWCTSNRLIVVVWLVDDVDMTSLGMPYLDIIYRLRESTALPIAAYQVSGEYSMIKAACEKVITTLHYTQNCLYEQSLHAHIVLFVSLVCLILYCFIALLVCWFVVSFSLQCNVMWLLFFWLFWWSVMVCDGWWWSVMVCDVANKGWLNEKDAVMESLLSFKRAGADIILTYFAKQVAEWLHQK